MFKKGSYFYYAMANGMFYFSWAMFASIISVYLAGIGCDATEISLITSSSALFAIITQPVAGLIADKINSPKTVSLVCAVAAIISGMMFAYSKSFIFLFLFNGATQGMLNGIVALSDRLATAAPFPYGTIRVWGSILYAIGCQVTGLVYESISPTANYYIFALSMLLTIAGFIGMYDAKLQKPAIKPKTSENVFQVLLKNKPFLLFLLIYSLFWGTAGAQAVYMPLMMTDSGATTGLIGTTFLLGALSEIPMVLFSDKIMSRFSYRALMIFACVMSLIRYGWYATIPNPTYIMYAFFFQGTTTIVFMMVTVRLMMELVDERYLNSAYGISNMIAKGIAVVIFQIVFGQIVNFFGYTAMYGVAFVITAVALLLCLGFRPVRK